MKFTLPMVMDVAQVMALEYKDNPEGWYTERRGYSFREPFGKGVEFSAYPDCGHCYRVDADTACVVFKGTHNLRGWMSNTKCFPEPSIFAEDAIPITKKIDTDVMVHPGFQSAWKLMRLQVYTFVAPFRRVIITGHSRGGAIAVAAAENMAFDCPDKEIACIPFCPARYGNNAFVRDYSKRVKYSLRISFANDPVPHTPPEAMGYCHVPQGIHLEPSWWQPQYWALPFNPTAHYPEHPLREIPRQLKNILPEA